ncbi:MAG: hypothetical protein Sylvanvirus1_49 [Sylvanvirus sp.]|uniref:Uncharacterized protein n=1 Tax=Sylvanvirus sp. TaxID=2487774 RepID=A0A3G5AK06_9VIRU|nr:MAG: hypothetical protein Sylvanvirus1_49 [Sylvanvirus sp.]
MLNPLSPSCLHIITFPFLVNTSQFLSTYLNVAHTIATLILSSQINISDPGSTPLIVYSSFSILHSGFHVCHFYYQQFIQGNGWKFTDHTLSYLWHTFGWVFNLTLLIAIYACSTSMIQSSATMVHFQEGYMIAHFVTHTLCILGHILIQYFFTSTINPNCLSTNQSNLSANSVNSVNSTNVNPSITTSMSNPPVLCVHSV